MQPRATAFTCVDDFLLICNAMETFRSGNIILTLYTQDSVKLHFLSSPYFYGWIPRCQKIKALWHTRKCSLHQVATSSHAQHLCWSNKIHFNIHFARICYIRFNDYHCSNSTNADVSHTTPQLGSSSFCKYVPERW